jgi:hypothetical protein
MSAGTVKELDLRMAITLIHMITHEIPCHCQSTQNEINIIILEFAKSQKGVGDGEEIGCTSEHR